MALRQIVERNGISRLWVSSASGEVGQTELAIMMSASRVMVMEQLVKKGMKKASRVPASSTDQERCHAYTGL